MVSFLRSCAVWQCLLSIAMGPQFRAGVLIPMGNLWLSFFYCRVIVVLQNGLLVQTRVEVYFSETKY